MTIKQRYTLVDDQHGLMTSYPFPQFIYSELADTRVLLHGTSVNHRK